MIVTVQKLSPIANKCIHPIIARFKEIALCELDLINKYFNFIFSYVGLFF